MWQIAKFNFFRQINIFLNTLKIKGCSLWRCLRVKIFSYLLFYKIKRTTIQQSTHFNNKYDWFSILQQEPTYKNLLNKEHEAEIRSLEKYPFPYLVNVSKCLVIDRMEWGVSRS